MTNMALDARYRMTPPSKPHQLRTGPTGLPVLSALDVAWGFPFGTMPYPAAPGPVPCGRVADPVLALREAVRPALRRRPCLVAFSGGRDSSLLLAIAADLAAREGHEPPVALTFRYPRDAAAEESAWQHLVIDHLRSRGARVEWECIQVGSELDMVGPVVGPILREHGHPLWPPALGSTALLSGLARGGTLMTGNYGDEVLGGHRANVLRTVVHRRGRGLSWAAWGEATFAVAPTAVRRAIARAQATSGDWLRPAFRREWVRRFAAHQAVRPIRWDAAVRGTLIYRSALLGTQSMRRTAERNDCRLVEPFGSAEFVQSLAAFGGRWGIGGRSAAVRLLADGLLPAPVIDRTSKAYFNASRFGPETSAFVASWDGTGLDDDAVDPKVLRELWRARTVSAPTAMLLQQAWLSAQRQR